MSKTKPTINHRQKKIYIIYTGGTIGMQISARGYQPAPGLLARQMAQMPEFRSSKMPCYTVCEYPSLIDSSNIQPAHWNQIAEDIYRNYDEYDGFIILHGTDTMAYTASALSFMLENLGKPVIITGSQLPIAEIRNDARETLITALFLITNFPIPEVCLYFHHRLMRGNRTRKIDTEDFNAFDSPNFPPLATIGIKINEGPIKLFRQKKQKLHVQKIINSINIASLRLFPGFNLQILKQVLMLPLQALILETFGAGNAPDNQPELIKLLQEASSKKILIVNCTQCLRGQVNMQQYATGTVLHDAGLISAHDMTPEATIAKLFYLFSKNYSQKKIAQQLGKNIRGEMS